MSLFPYLTEPGVTSFLNDSLTKCHQKRVIYYNILWNVGFFLVFVIFFGSLIFYKYKGKLTPTELKEKDLKKHKYILEKIQMLREDKMKLNDTLITGLPNWNAEF